MDKEVEKIISDTIRNLSLVRSEDIPNIDLYMDQVTTFMEKQLASLKRTPDEKILTKTMINNYVKNNLLPPPDKKKYSKEHVIMLTFIYYFKGFLSINDIDTLLQPIRDQYFSGDKSVTLTQIYDEVCGTSNQLAAELFSDLAKKCRAADDTFEDVKDDEERRSLQIFALVCMLSFDAYVKKMLVENFADHLKEERERKAQEAEASSKNKTKSGTQSLPPHNL
ncbi:MAG: DUF1836 domain-containing protein [Lachnospiraceae bacterium]|nr:DUF1836 domain-containing protein [Lachnospiraceae bacterium]